MPVRPPDTVPITLADDEIRLITDVLRNAVAECSAVTTPYEHPDTALAGGITLGRLAVHWGGIVCGRPIPADGPRLRSVSQNREAWYQVRAALSDHAAQASRDVELEGSAADARARQRAHDALLLADRIAEASHGW